MLDGRKAGKIPIRARPFCSQRPGSQRNVLIEPALSALLGQSSRQVSSDISPVFVAVLFYEPSEEFILLWKREMECCRSCRNATKNAHAQGASHLRTEKQVDYG